MFGPSTAGAAVSDRDWEQKTGMEQKVWGRAKREHIKIINWTERGLNQQIFFHIFSPPNLVLWRAIPVFLFHNEKEDIKVWWCKNKQKACLNTDAVKSWEEVWWELKGGNGVVGRGNGWQDFKGEWEDEYRKGVAEEHEMKREEPDWGAEFEDNTV